MHHRFNVLDLSYLGFKCLIVGVEHANTLQSSAHFTGTAESLKGCENSLRLILMRVKTGGFRGWLGQAGRAIL